MLLYNKILETTFQPCATVPILVFDICLRFAWKSFKFFIPIRRPSISRLNRPQKACIQEKESEPNKKKISSSKQTQIEWRRYPNTNRKTKKKTFEKKALEISSRDEFGMKKSLQICRNTIKRRGNTNHLFSIFCSCCKCLQVFFRSHPVCK